MIKITKEIIASAFAGKTIDGLDAIQDSILASVNNYVSTMLPSELSAKASEVKGQTFQLFDDILKKHGYTEPTSEKTTEWLDQMLTKNKNEITEKTAKLTDLEKQIKEGSGDANLKSQLEIATQQSAAKDKQIELLKTEKKTEIEKLKTENKATKIKLIIEKSLPKIKKDSLNEEILKLTRKGVIDDLAAKADEDAEGNIIFKGEDGKILLNPENKQLPFTPEEMASKHKLFENIIETSTTATGLGTGTTTTTTTGTDGKTKADISKYRSAKSKDELTEMIQKDYTIGTAEFMEVYKNDAFKDLK